MKKLTGGCLCQKVRYRLSTAPMSQGICYCHQCQKSGGAYGSPLMVIHKNSFECIDSDLSKCITLSDRGSQVTRNFCKSCGSHLFSQISDVPDIVTVKAATLDEFSNFIPEYLVWIQSASPSCVLPSGIPSFLENAPFEMMVKVSCKVLEIV